MKTGVKILSTTDRTIAVLMCTCKSGLDICAESGLNRGTIYNKIAAWKRYYEVRDYSELATIFKGLLKYSPTGSAHPAGVYDNKQFNS